MCAQFWKEGPNGSWSLGWIIGGCHPLINPFSSWILWAVFYGPGPFVYCVSRKGKIPNFWKLGCPVIQLPPIEFFFPNKFNSKSQIICSLTTFFCFLVFFLPSPFLSVLVFCVWWTNQDLLYMENLTYMFCLGF